MSIAWRSQASSLPPSLLPSSLSRSDCVGVAPIVNAGFTIPRNSILLEIITTVIFSRERSICIRANCTRSRSVVSSCHRNRGWTFVNLALMYPVHAIALLALSSAASTSLTTALMYVIASIRPSRVGSGAAVEFFGSLIGWKSMFQEF